MVNTLPSGKPSFSAAARSPSLRGQSLHWMSPPRHFSAAAVMTASGEPQGGPGDREHSAREYQVPAARAPGAYTVVAKLNYRKVDQFLINYMFGENSGLSAPVVEDYLRHALHFELDRGDLDGLRLFYRLAAEEGLIPPARPLAFTPGS